nr:caspase [Parasteatoda tepidariorum]
MASSRTTDSIQSEKDETDLFSPENYCFGDSPFSKLLKSADVLINTDDFVFSMAYDKIGKCLIFNHTAYSPNLELKPRSCGDPDAKRFKLLFEELDFDVEICKNHEYCEIMKELSEVNEAGFDNYGCFVCCIMTHGFCNGMLYAYDTEYRIDDVWDYFCSDKCPTLAKKPKIFIIQACRGEDPNFGQKVSFCRESEDLGDSEEADLKNIEDGISLIPDSPIYSDFLTAYSTYDGFFSFRNSHFSYFITAFCDKLKQNHKKLDLVSILTLVNFEIAYNFRSHSKDPSENNLKQMTCFDSSLTKLVRFP